MTKTEQHEDECGCVACLAPIIDGLSWPELPGDEDSPKHLRVWRLAQEAEREQERTRRERARKETA